MKLVCECGHSRDFHENFHRFYPNSECWIGWANFLGKSGYIQGKNFASLSIEACGCNNFVLDNIETIMANRAS
jgi:hypothetical protein